MYFSLSDFSRKLEKKGLLVHVHEEVSSVLEITEIQRRLIARGGPAVIFHRVLQNDRAQYSNTNTTANLSTNHTSLIPSTMPVICNLFGTVERIALALGFNSINNLRELGLKLAELRNPTPPHGWLDIKNKLPILGDVMNMRPKFKVGGPCQELYYLGDKVNLYSLPIQTCWPGEPAPLITWGMVITRGSYGKESKEINSTNTSDYNAGIYRLQLLSHNKLIVRWLKHRGGADHYRQWQKSNKESNTLGQAEQKRSMPIAVVIGCQPSMLLSAVLPLPENVSEYSFAGLLAKKRLNLTSCLTIPMYVPSSAEIVLEGYINLDELAEEGPYGDHTGFYNEKELFPVMTVTAISMRRKPLYLTTYTGKPMDEPSVLGVALNEVFIPLIQRQFPEIIDFWLPPEACSYRVAVVSIKKAYPGHAKRIMMGIWSYLRQFTYTKMIIVVDENIEIRNWSEVMWAVSTHMDFKRDITLVHDTPIDYLDFATSKAELGTKMGFDATTKIGNEIERKWGIPIKMDEDIIQMVNHKWQKYGFNSL